MSLLELKLLEKKAIPHFIQSDKEKEINKFLDKREQQLKRHRKNVFGQDIDALMIKADKDCQIKEEVVDGSGKRILAENEELGQRGVSSFVDLGVENWQSRAASNDPYVKLMIALSILFDNDPRANVSPAAKRYAAVNEVTKQLYENSWRTSFSKEVLKAFIFDIGKYGWAVGRTALQTPKRTISEIIEFNVENNEVKEENRIIEDFTKVVRERLDPHRVWLDDKTKANNQESIKDWMWEKDYNYDDLEAEFGDSKNFKFIQIGGNKLKSDDIAEESEKELQDEIYTVQFYENWHKDRFVARVKSEGQWIILENNPLADHKELSCWTTFWTIRHPDTPYGVSLVEIMRSDKKLKNKVKNMTMDQLLLSIYKMGFVENNKAFKGQTRLKIKPGHIEEGISAVNWLEVPGPGQDAKYGIDYLQSEIDANTGIVPQLGGEIVGKTAYEIGQAKESALKRLKLPLDNICYALEIEAGLSIPLMWQAYTTPLVEHIVNQTDIDAYLKEINSDPKFYFIDEDQFYAKRYKEFELSVKEENGMWIPTGDNKFFYNMPQFMRWKGTVRIRATSLLSTWKELEKMQKKDMTKTVIELLQLGPKNGMKPMKQLLLAYDENPNDWLPEEWLRPEQSQEAKIAVAAKEMFGANVPEEMMANLPKEMQIPEMAAEPVSSPPRVESPITGL